MVILAETDAGRSISPANVQNENMLIRQQWKSPPDEALFGLGQKSARPRPSLKGYDLISSSATPPSPSRFSSPHGYGVTLGQHLSHASATSASVSIPRLQMFDKDNHLLGGLTATCPTPIRISNMKSRRARCQYLHLHPRRKAAGQSAGFTAHSEKGDFSVRWKGSILPAQTGDYQFKTFSNSGIKLWLDDKRLRPLATAASGCRNLTW